MKNPLRTGRKQKTMRVVAIVEGTDRGVPFRVQYKRMDAAERDAKRFHDAVLHDMNTGEKRRYIHEIDEWRVIV